MFTRPGDLPESSIADALDELWGLRAGSLEYQPVGFGSPSSRATRAGEDGEFASDEDRRAILDLVIEVHRARDGHPRAEDFMVPNLDALHAMIGQTSTDWGVPGHTPGRPANCSELTPAT